MNAIKKIVCYALLLTTTTQLICSDSWWSRFTNYLSSWKNSALATAASSTSTWIKQNPGKTTLAIGGLTAAGVACYLYGNKNCNRSQHQSSRVSKYINENLDKIKKENDQYSFTDNFSNPTEQMKVLKNIVTKLTEDETLQNDDAMIIGRTLDEFNPSNDTIIAQRARNIILDTMITKPDEISFTIRRAQERVKKELEEEYRHSLREEIEKDQTIATYLHQLSSSNDIISTEDIIFFVLQNKNSYEDYKKNPERNLDFFISQIRTMKKSQEEAAQRRREEDQRRREDDQGRREGDQRRREEDQRKREEAYNDYSKQSLIDDFLSRHENSITLYDRNRDNSKIFFNNNFSGHLLYQTFFLKEAITTAQKLEIPSLTELSSEIPNEIDTIRPNVERVARTALSKAQQLLLEIRNLRNSSIEIHPLLEIKEPDADYSNVEGKEEEK